MVAEIGTKPRPGDVWGLDILDPASQAVWSHSKWQETLAKPGRTPLLLCYEPSAERTALRSLKKLAGFARAEHYKIIFISPQNVPKFPLMSKKRKCLYLIHRASRFLNLIEWLARLGKNHDNLFVLTIPSDEMSSIPDKKRFCLTDVPAISGDLAARRAREIITHFMGNLEELDQPFADFVMLVAEAGVAGIGLQVALIVRALNQSYIEVLRHLVRPEICDLIKLSQAGPLAGRRVSFRGRWLAETVVPAAKEDEYPRLQELLQHIDASELGDSRFVLNFCAALKAQGMPDTLAKIRRNWKSRISECHQTAKQHGEGLAWLMLFHHDLLKLASLFFYSVVQGWRRLPVWHPSFFDLKGRIRLFR